jgi:hypothetical protein
MNVKGVLTMVKKVLSQEKEQEVSEFKNELKEVLSEFNGGNKMSELKEKIEDKTEIVNERLEINGISFDDFIVDGFKNKAEQVVILTAFKAKELFLEKQELKKEIALKDLKIKELQDKLKEIEGKLRNEVRVREQVLKNLKGED